jgi:ankyrin repeat protein
MKQTFFALLLALSLGASAAHAQATDIFDAARADDVKTVQALLDKKADINQVDESGYTALTLASYNGSPNVVALLLKDGASTEVTDPMGRTALMAAAFQGDAQSIKLLLAHGAKVNVLDANGATSLEYAVEFGRKAVIKPLLDAKADPTIKDVRGMSAISIAQGQDNPDPELLKMLTDAAAAATAAKPAK